jgi:predicted Ser/Thr protein kinase
MAIQDALPDRLGPYRLLDRIGEGGMGVVHLAADAENRMVAVKVLRPQAAGDSTARRRLAREVETMRRVRSPFVAEVIDADVTGNIPYIVTRYVPGRTLEEVVEIHGPLDSPRLHRLACGLAGALAAVHGAGVVHRDLKPGNVMLVGDDPVVIDFGIAQVGDTTRLTQTGMFMGTPGYLAPEVIEGQPSGPPADVHSWGATVAFAATGQPPYGTGSYEVVFYRILQGSPRLDGVRGGLHMLVAAAMTREPSQRPTAAWLAAQTARPDLLAAVPATRAGPWDGARQGAVMTPGTAPVARPAPVPRTTVAGGAAGGRAAGIPANFAVSANTRLRPGELDAPGHRAVRDVADLLPPVRYGPPADNGQGQRLGQPARQGGAARPARPPRRHRVLALAALVIAVCGSVVLPVAGTAAALFVIAALRAGDRAQSGLAVRRSARGPRPTDVLLVALSAPWTLARSLLVTVALAPFLLLAAGVVTIVAIIVLRGSPLALAGAYGAGVYVALNCLGPGSRRPRRQLNRVFNAIAASRLSAFTVMVVLGALAAAMVSLALLRAPVFWPVPDPASLLAHLPGAGTLLRLRHLGHGLISHAHVS